MSRYAPVGELSALDLRVLRVLRDNNDAWVDLHALCEALPREDSTRVLAAATGMRRSRLVTWYRAGLDGRLRFKLTPHGARELAAIDQLSIEP